MITFNTIDETYIKIEYSKDSDFQKLYQYFSLEIPGAEYMDKVRAGIMDGMTHFINAKGYIYWGLKDKAITFCKTEGIEYQDLTIPVEDDFNPKEFLEFMDKLGLLFTPYKHQLKGTILSLRNKRAVVCSATGSGKSLVIYILCRYFIWKQKRILLLVPRVDLVNQMHDDFVDYFTGLENKLIKSIETSEGIDKVVATKKLNKLIQDREDLNCNDIEEHMHLIFGGKEKNSDKAVIISTRDSLSLGQGRVNPDYFKGIDVFMGDEIHQIGCNTAKEIVQECSNTPYKIGFTGSLSNDTIENLKIEGLIGPAHKIISMRELIDLGLATNVLIQPLYLKYCDDIIKAVKKMKWTEEDKFIRNCQPRNEMIAKLANKFPDKNVLVIYKNIDMAENIAKEIIKLRSPDTEYKTKDYQKDNDLKVYISKGDTKAQNRNDFRGLLEKSEGNILLGTTQVISTGINIKNVHCFIFAGIGKKDTLIVQSIGRIVRLHESKDNAKIYDLVDDLVYTVKRSGNQYPNYNYKHWIERLNIYNNQEMEVLEPLGIQLNVSKDSLF